MNTLHGIGLGMVIAVAVAAMATIGTTLAQDSSPGPRAPFDERFTYQGRLDIDGLPANGAHTIKVEVWDAQAGGAMLTSSSAELTVANGLFSMTVDAGDLDGQQRWLQAYAWDGAQFVQLGGRQELTPVAYAIFAKEAGSLSSEAAAGFIQNGTVLQPSSDFHISGTGIADGALDAGKYRVGGVDFAYTFGTSGTGLALGLHAGNGAITAANNSFVGFRSGDLVTTGIDNTGVGSVSFSNLSTGQGNTAVGAQSMSVLTTGSFNTAIGFQSALFANGENNVAVGYQAGYISGGIDNTMVGAEAGKGFFQGYSNVFIGKSAGKGVQNESNGSQNVAVGTSAARKLEAGFLNTVLGDNSGPELTDGLANTVVGWAAGDDLTIGDSNTLVGGQAGDKLVTGNSNTALGYLSGFNQDGLSFATAIGAQAVAVTNNQVQLGRISTDTVRIGRLLSGGPALPVCHNGQVLADCSSSRRYKTNITSYAGGIDVLAQLRPVTFDWKEDGSHDIGFVAEEVEAVDPLLVTYLDGRVEGVKYDRLTTVLANSVMEQQAQIDALAAGLAPGNASSIDARLAALEAGSGDRLPLLAGVIFVALMSGGLAGFVAGRARRS